MTTNRLDRLNLDALRAGAFGRLPYPLQQLLLDAARPRQVPARTRLFEQGVAADAWYGVVAGAVCLSMPLVDGRTMTLEVAGPGDFFGEPGRAPGQRSPQQHDAQTIGPTTLLVLDGEDFRRLMQAEPAFGAFVTQMLAARLHAAHRAATQLVEASLETRVARKLHDLGHRFGVRVDDEIRINLPIIQRDVAEMVGASRQRVNVAVQALIRRGVLRLEARTRSIFLCESFLGASKPLLSRG
ncbi:Crp/Fnr family transcriptional regulator [Paucibacter sp. R3-3]|uniref:Crp/Fnr family transcriptional regulator n=1 Tax=Roseateles agri TaxID=3098619 RepID=A0ABU5DJU8_9BURK|nr:Crp/Fnr family transcriptional regulator [Paucibacter sp. R3-3]MDY0746409.1 Crp/Fnr family transcriptional regulator [Paucibacter sp. R3-3]